MIARRLFLSRVETDFNPARDVAAGPWCFVESEEDFDGWEDFPFTDAFADTQDLITADAVTRRLANHIALSWADKMNAKTKRNYSSKMWRDFLILWMVAAVQSTWRCYRNIELLIKRHGEEHFHVRILESNPNWPINNLSDFMRLLTLDGYFTFWMNSLTLRYIAPKKWTLEPVEYETSHAIGMPKQSSNFYKTERRNRISAFIGRLGFDHVQGTRLIRLFFVLLINVLPRLPAVGKKFISEDHVLEEFPGAYFSILDEFLESTLPLSFGDGLLSTLSEAESLKFYPGRLTVTHAGSVDAYNHLITVLAVENGERVVGFQHGGWYGVAGSGAWACESEYIYHAFITWGWTKQADYFGNMIPLPSPMLSKIRNTHSPRNDRLIFVGTRMIIQNDRFDARPSSVRWLNYRKIKLNFVNTLHVEPRKALYYRPYHRREPPLEDGSYMRRHIPNLPILEGSLHKQATACRLVVMDHPGTTLHLLMASNIPTVCYWDPKDWPLCSQANVQFELLRKANILFDNPEAAAAHVNVIWSNVQDWWNGSQICDARREWLAYHARTSSIWWWYWVGGIWRLATGRELKYKRGQNLTP